MSEYERTIELARESAGRARNGPVVWGQGDVVSIPLNAWHQHFNDDSTRPVRYLGVTNIPLLRAMGLNRLEDAEA